MDPALCVFASLPVPGERVRLSGNMPRYSCYYLIKILIVNFCHSFVDSCGITYLIIGIIFDHIENLDEYICL